MMAVALSRGRFHLAAASDRGGAALQEGVGASQQRTHGHYGRWNGVQSETRKPRIRLGTDVRKSDLFEWHGRQVQHAGSTSFLFSVDVVHIFVRMTRDAVASHLQHFIPITEAQAVSRASLDARRCGNVLAEPLIFFCAQWLSVEGCGDWLIGAVSTVSTLLYLRSERVPFRRWDSPGACPFAVASADAFIRVIADSIG